MSFIFLLVELFCNVLWKWLRVCLVGLFKGLLGLLTSKKSKILKTCIWLSFPKELSKKQTWKLLSRRSSHHPTSRWNWACILLRDAHDDDGDFAGMNRKSGGDFFFFVCVANFSSLRLYSSLTLLLQPFLPLFLSEKRCILSIPCKNASCVFHFSCHCCICCFVILMGILLFFI